MVTHTLGRSGICFCPIREIGSDLSFPQDGAFKFLVVNVGENNNINSISVKMRVENNLKNRHFSLKMVFFNL